MRGTSPPTDGENRASYATETEASPPLQSGVVTSPADAMLSEAIAASLGAAPSQRSEIFRSRVCEIERFMAEHPEERPWTCVVYSGTDGSTVFRGGVGHSLVIDPAGRMWRARSYEDFETTYRFDDGSCQIDTLTPLYEQMREYRPRAS
jgi:hypothetical protein